MALFKRTFVDAYTGHNVGDDLFLKILFERYPNNSFLLCGDKGYKKKLESYKNVYVVSRTPFFLYNKICWLLKWYALGAENIIASLCENAIEIGGSLFIEPSVPVLCYGAYKKLPYVIMGANFGPYKSESYLERCHDFIKKAKKVCFREQKSYETFKGLKNTSVAPDIAFNLKMSHVKSDKQLFVSVMDFSICNTKNAMYQCAYEKFLLDMANHYLKKGWKIVLCSFCEQEGDEKVVQRLYHELQMDENIECIFYKDDLQEIITSIQKSEKIIATRFHSMIIGLNAGNKVYPICYSNKTKNVLEDLGLSDYILEIQKLGEIKIEQIEACQLSQETLAQIRVQAEKQFEGVEKCLMC